MASGGVRSLRGATPTWCALGTEARRGQGGGSSTSLPAVATLGPLRGRGFAQERITVGMATKQQAREPPLPSQRERGTSNRRARAVARRAGRVRTRGSTRYAGTAGAKLLLSR